MSKKQPIEIHQLVSSIAYGDGISNGILFIQKLLRKAGFKSNIYICINYVDINFKNEVLHIRQYKKNVNNLILYHHSTGNSYFNFVKNFEAKKIIIYHNITPSHFFDGSFYRNKTARGRKQLADSATCFIGSIGDSEYNCTELKYYNYSKPTAIPLLVDLDINIIKKTNNKIQQQNISTFNIIFVGRVTQNKCQQQLIDVMYWLHIQGQKNIKLFIIGGNFYSDLYQYLFSYRDKLGLTDDIVITGKVNTRDLYTYYNIADLYLSLSEHEGFAMPLLEAIKNNTPVLAYASGAIPTTIGNNGLLYQKAADKVGEQVLDLKDNPKKRKQLIFEQQKHLENFSCAEIEQKFFTYLSSQNFI
ncbi:MAG: glycosyltransferase [Pseudomonadota bacterium]